MSRELAKSLAQKYHAGQLYGETDSYEFHLKGVEALIPTVADATVRWDELAQVAWLHDILEDTDIDPSIINTLFSEEVSGAVWAITKQKDETRENYLSRVKANKRALIIKKADTWFNLQRSFLNQEPRRIKKYTDQLRELYT